MYPVKTHDVTKSNSTFYTMVYWDYSIDNNYSHTQAKVTIRGYVNAGKWNQWSLWLKGYIKLSSSSGWGNAVAAKICEWDSNYQEDIGWPVTGSKVLDKGHSERGFDVGWDAVKTSWSEDDISYGPVDVTSVNELIVTSSAESGQKIAAITHYSISYNANAGTDSVSNMPGSATKWYGEDLPVSSTIPVRGDGTIWEFVGWDTDQDATTPTYPVGQTNNYTANNGATLYAIWKLKGHWITYNTQGGTPVPSPYLKTIGTTAYITSIIPQKEGYKFKEWNGNSSGTSTTKFNPASSDTDTYPLKTYSLDNDLNLYAIWEKNDSKLKIKNGNKWISVTAKDFDALTYNQLNTKIDNGLVPEGDGHPRCAWATDANGNPGWYAYASMFLPELGADVYPTNYDGNHNVGTVFLQKFGKIVFMTLNYLKTTSGWPSDFYSDQWYGQTPLIIPEEFRPLYKVHIPELLRVEQQGALSVCAAEDEHAGGIGWHSLASSGQTLSATTFWDTFMWLTPDDSEGD